MTICRSLYPARCFCMLLRKYDLCNGEILLPCMLESWLRRRVIPDFRFLLLPLAFHVRQPLTFFQTHIRTLELYHTLSPSPLHPSPFTASPSAYHHDFRWHLCLSRNLDSQGAQRAVDSSSSPGQIAAGKALLKAALILQLFVLALFVAVASRFHYNCNKAGMLATACDTRRRILGVLATLYMSSTLIGTRTIYRTVEYFATAAIHAPQEGEVYDLRSISPVIRYEWFFYVFEVTLMWVNTVMWNFRHPGKYLPRDITTYLGEDGVEREGCKFKDPRRIMFKSWTLSIYGDWSREMIRKTDGGKRQMKVYGQIRSKKQMCKHTERCWVGTSETGQDRRIFLLRMIPHLHTSLSKDDPVSRAELSRPSQGRMVLLEWRISTMHVDVILSRIVGYDGPLIVGNLYYCG